MSAGILWNLAPQGSEEWLAARRGLVTGSIAAIAREQVVVQRAKAAKVDRKTGEVVEAERPEILGPSAACLLKARDLARERVGGRPQDIYTNAAMRLGQAEEPVARIAYEDRTGYLVEEVGFAFTEDRRFGCSVDGLIHRPGSSSRAPRIWECKTIVSSDLLFKAVIGGNVSEWIDQCLFNMWLLTADAVELYLHVWDLPELSRIVVIERDEAEIEAIEADMVDFEAMVAGNEALLRRALVGIEFTDPSPDPASCADAAKACNSHPPTHEKGLSVNVFSQ